MIATTAGSQAEEISRTPTFEALQQMQSLLVSFAKAFCFLHSCKIMHNRIVMHLC